MSSFGEKSEKELLLSLFVKHLVAWIFCVFHDNQKVHSASTSLTHFRFAFFGDHCRHFSL